jgi:hypothetical protein
MTSSEIDSSRCLHVPLYSVEEGTAWQGKRYCGYRGFDGEGQRCGSNLDVGGTHALQQTH